MHETPPRKAIFQHRPKDECGVFAVFNHPQASEITFFGLYALQHRGQESAGIVTSGNKDRKFKEHHGMGFGVLATVNGVGDFISSIVVGALWTAWGTQVAFAYSTVLFAAGSFVVWRSRGS